VKTFVVRVGQQDWMGNAETPEEAVLFAIARTGMDAPTFLVYDHDANRFEIPRPEPKPAES